MEVDQFKEAHWRSHLLKAFSANTVLKPFKWAGQGVILLDIKTNNVVAKAMYDPRCAGVNLSQHFFQKMGLAPTSVVPLIISLEDGVMRINRRVFYLINITWKSTHVELPAFVLPGTGFDLLLDLKWIFKTGEGSMLSAMFWSIVSIITHLNPCLSLSRQKRW